MLRNRARLTQEEVARRLGHKRPAPVSLIERPNDKVPKAKTIVRYAKALECQPRELLEDVETEYDRLRAGIYPVVAVKKAPPKGGKSKRAG